MEPKIRKIPLADRIAALSTPTPLADLDDDPELATVGRRKEVADYVYDEFDDDMQPSALRKQLDIGVQDDPKYLGVKVSRKALADQWGDSEDQASDGIGGESEDEDGQDMSEEEEEEPVERKPKGTKAAKKRQKQSDQSGSEDEVVIGDESESDSEDDHSYGSAGEDMEGEGLGEGDSEVEGEGEGEDGDDGMDEEERKLMEEYEKIRKEESEDIQAFSRVDVHEEVQKGEHVRTQLRLWDSLMETRIRLQKAVNVCNQFAQPATQSVFVTVGSSKVQSAVAQAEAATKGLLSDLLQLQQAFCSNGPDEGQAEASRKRKRPAEDTSVDGYWKYIKTTDDGFRTYRDTVLTKWSNKVNLSAGGLAGSKQLKAINQTVVVQVERMLQDEDRLLRRTQLKRSSYRPVGQPEKAEQPPKDGEENDEKSGQNEEHDPEIFDDTDFYHHLLRDLISSRSRFGEGDDPLAMGQQWLEVQRLRTKVKRKVDTKASKGRKIRYKVMPELVGYMFPVEKGTSDEATRNELYKSLFGTSA